MPPPATGSEQLMRAMRSLESIFLIGVEGVTEISLVRHADCYREMTEVVDPPLSALGREQARRLAERVRRHPPAAVYSSPLRRATETARAISDNFTEDDRLVEMALQISEDGALDFQETHDSAVARMRGVIDEVVRVHEGQRVILVCHAASIVACLTDVMRLQAGQLRLLPYYTSISTVRVLSDRHMVGALGDIAHLE
ncbi:MAG TPA: histidine phosphatase family protein [Candidatus Dormibacteraeota bacterium]|nr:histidine phosphatase family protein [Candidatus Dormibacteraeota bacterium]